MPSRACPVCQGTRVEKLYRQSFEMLSEGGLLDGYDVVICEGCGAGFADNIPDQAAFDSYYASFSKYEYAHRGGVESPADAKRLEQMAREISAFIPSTDSPTLDIGSGNGKLVAALHKLGYKNAQGLDPSPGCARAARELYGVEVLTHTIFNLPQDRQYDLLSLFGVLEHIRDVRRAVDNLRPLAAPGAILYVAVPDFSDLLAVQDAPFQEFSTEHINFFSPGSLSNLLRIAGWEEISCRHVLSDQGHGPNSSNVIGVFRNRAPANRAIVKDPSTRTGLTRYIEQCRAVDQGLRAKLASQLHPGDGLIVWGVGTHTRRLLSSGHLKDAKIVAFVDSSPKFQGQSLHSVPILSPKELADRTHPILISSYGAQEEIRKQIQNELKLKNRLITLYDFS